jgi:ribosome-associated protein
LTDWAAEAKAEDIVLLDVRRSTYIADYFVICTATSERHLAALGDRIREQARDLGVDPTHIEGTPDSGWLLIDYGDVILHLFSATLREFYHIEKVWSDAAVVVRVL